MEYGGDIGYTINKKEEKGDLTVMRVVHTTTTLPVSQTVPNNFNELERIVHTISRMKDAFFERNNGFIYTFGDFDIGMEPPAQADAKAFPLCFPFNL